MIENYKELRDFFTNRIKKSQSPNNAEINSNNLLISAVLVPLAIHNGEVVLVFTKRSSSLERHSGQISFPGGVQENNDRTLMDTAIRETREEIGIDDSQIEVLGSLDSFNSSTGFNIKPFIGWLHDLNGMKPNVSEVEKIICVPFNWIKDSGNAEIRDYQGDHKKSKKVWFYKSYDGEVIWGITATIIKEFLSIIEK